MKGLGARLHRARRSCGMSQREAAGRLSVCISTICGWERDRSEPGFDMLYRIAELYGTTVSSLLRPLYPGNVVAIRQIRELGKQLTVANDTDDIAELAERLRLLVGELYEQKRADFLRATKRLEN